MKIEGKQTPIMLRPYMSIEFENITVEEQVIYQDYIGRCKMGKITSQVMLSNTKPMLAWQVLNQYIHCRFNKD